MRNWTSSLLEQEIRQQPDVMKELLRDEQENVDQIARNINGRFHYIVIAARGSSDNAARYAQYLFGAHNHIQVALATPSLFSLYQKPPDLSGALVIGISQSGRSPDINAVLIEAHRQGCPSIAITNNFESPLAGNADHCIHLHADPELAVAATKSYTASLGALALLSTMLSGDQSRLEELHRTPQWMDQTLVGMAPALPIIQRYRYMQHCSVLARGINYATAFEAALKIKELNRIVAEPYSSADFRHGPIATVYPGFPILLIAPRGPAHADMVDLIRHLKSLKAELLIISDDEESLGYASLPMPLPAGIPEWISPMISVLPAQVFSLILTGVKGLDPDQPQGLTKITETL